MFAAQLRTRLHNVLSSIPFISIGRFAHEASAV
ncbi:hypothetical protein COAQ111491_06520 [Comamonas aquatilis]